MQSSACYFLLLWKPMHKGRLCFHSHFESCMIQKLGLGTITPQNKRTQDRNQSWKTYKNTVRVENKQEQAFRRSLPKRESRRHRLELVQTFSGTSARLESFSLHPQAVISPHSYIWMTLAKAGPVMWTRLANIYYVLNSHLHEQTFTFTEVNRVKADL